MSSSSSKSCSSSSLTWKPANFRSSKYISYYTVNKSHFIYIHDIFFNVYTKKRDRAEYSTKTIIKSQNPSLSSLQSTHTNIIRNNNYILLYLTIIIYNFKVWFQYIYVWEEKRPAYFLNPTCQPCHCALKFTHPIQIAAANLQIIHISSLKNIMTKMGKGKENELSNISKHVTYTDICKMWTITKPCHELKVKSE